MYTKCNSTSGCVLLPQTIMCYIFTWLEEENENKTTSFACTIKIRVDTEMKGVGRMGLGGMLQDLPGKTGAETSRKKEVSRDLAL